MTFIWPIMLVSLLLIPLFVAFYLRRQRQRRENLAKYGSLGLIQESGGRQAGGKGTGRRRHVPALLFMAALTVMLVALARPQAVVGIPRIESTVMLTFDVSGSMAAEDMQPNRMEAAKAAAREFVQRQPDTVKIGVAAFSDGGLAVQAPTNDQEAILAAIDRLSPERGTSLGNGILASLEAILGKSQPPAESEDATGETTPVPTPTALPEGTFIPASIVLLSDGENTNAPDPLAAALEAAQRGVRIYTIGIGSPAGATLEIEGFLVFTQLNEGMLQSIAEITEGDYFNAQNEEELRRVYDELDPELVIKAEKMEITSILAGASLIILLLSGLFSLLWYGRLG